jgi:hypothetical protein
MEAHLLLAKVHYLTGEFKESLEDIKSSRLDQVSPLELISKLLFPGQNLVFHPTLIETGRRRLCNKRFCSTTSVTWPTESPE